MSSSNLRIAVRLILGVTLGVVVLYAFAIYSFNRSMNKAFGPEFQKDAQDFGIALKGIAGESLFEHRTIIPSQANMPAGSNAIEQGKTLLATYRKDPEKFKKYGDLLETALNASAVADALLQMPASAKLPPTSVGITSVRAEQEIDAWGHPFCFLTARDRLAVISLGPDAKAPVSCQNLGISRKEIISAKRKLHERSTGEVILIVDRKAQKHALKQALQEP